MNVTYLISFAEQYLICFDAMVLAVALGVNAMAAIIILTKTPSVKSENIFLLNNLLCNLLCVCLMGPQFLTREPFDCAIVDFTISFITTSNSISIFLISVEQYINITDPLDHQQRLKKERILRFIVLQWSLSSLTGLLSTFSAFPAPGVWKICKDPNQLPEEIVFDYYRYFCAALIIFDTVLCVCATVTIQSCIADAAFCKCICQSLPHPFNNPNFDPARDVEEDAGVIEYKEVIQMTFITTMYCFFSQFSLALLQVYPSMGVIQYRGLLLGNIVTPFLFAYQKRQVKHELRKMWLNCKVIFSEARLPICQRYNR